MDFFELDRYGIQIPFISLVPILDFLLYPIAVQKLFGHAHKTQLHQFLVQFEVFLLPIVKFLQLVFGDRSILGSWTEAATTGASMH